jgi:Domain of unknown function (DUF4249)
MRGLIALTVFGSLALGCSKPLELPDTKPDTSIVVVEGDVVTGNDVDNTVLLSRVRSLADTTAAPVANAQVLVVDESGHTWPLTESGSAPGKYAASLTLDPARKYALRILSDGNTFESAFQASKPCPPIDSITFQQPTPADDATIYVHAHDPSNNTRFYRWQATETWERHSFYESFYLFTGDDIVTKPVGDQNYRCWQTEPVPAITIANTSGLSQDVVSYQPVATLRKDTEKGIVRYSILVKQIALTAESFNFWNTIKKNTELSGSLFDPQPSQYVTNITCKNDPVKKAIGFVSVSGSAEKRLFIMNSQLDSWPLVASGSCDAINFGKSFAIDFLKANPGYLVAGYNTTNGTYAVAAVSCVDCTLTGGTNVKPSFW